MSSELTPLLLLVLLLIVFWLVVLRPARNQQRTQQALQRSLEVGDDVVLSSGIFGTVTRIDETQVHLEVAPGTVVRVARQVVVRRVEDESAPQAGPEADEPEDASIVTDEHPEPFVATATEDGTEGSPAEQPTPETDDADPEPEPERAPATRTAAKKTAAKKTAKKTTAKKATAKKTAKKSSPEREDAEHG